MGIDTLIYLGIGAILVLLFLVVYFKDQESNKKFERFERIIEDLNRQNHQIKQALLRKDSEKDSLENLKNQFQYSAKEEVAEQVAPILSSLREIESIIEEFKGEQENRIAKLEERTKTFTLSQNASTSNEKQVIQLYKSGKNMQEIAKDLRIGLGEVEFILKMHNCL